MFFAKLISTCIRDTPFTMEIGFLLDEVCHEQEEDEECGVEVDGGQVNIQKVGELYTLKATQ